MVTALLSLRLATTSDRELQMVLLLKATQKNMVTSPDAKEKINIAPYLKTEQRVETDKNTAQREKVDPFIDHTTENYPEVAITVVEEMCLCEQAIVERRQDTGKKNGHLNECSI